MKETTKKIYDELFERYTVLASIKETVLNVFELIKFTYKNLLIGVK